LAAFAGISHSENTISSVCDDLFPASQTFGYQRWYANSNDEESHPQNIYLAAIAIKKIII
jgi:hypothetical protein